MRIFTADGSEWEVDPSWLDTVKQDAAENGDDVLGHMNDVLDDDEILSNLRLIESSFDLWELLLPTGYRWTDTKADLDDMPIYRDSDE